MFKLVSNFNKEIFEKTIIRVYPYKDYQWCQKDRWIDAFEKIKFDDNSITMYQSISLSKVVLGTYNSTTILEILAANIPIVLYWDPNYSEIRQSEKKYFEMLFNAKILHYNPIQASKFINDNWNDIDQWWESENVQTAVKLFCKRYALTSNSALLDWRKALISISG
jgi:putative transferase (TIGR04331 family)